MQSTHIIEVPISNLVPSKRNVRKSKTTREADQELLAGIRSQGLLQNLVVIPNGKPGHYEVTAGKRRLKALQQLVKEGHYQESTTVACRFFEDADSAEEISLIENTQRLRMHPADEFETIRKLQRKGMEIADIAAILGIPESTVRKRLKLAGVAPEIRRAYRRDEITLEALMAFTVEDSLELQRETFKQLSQEGTLYAATIRAQLRGESETSQTRVGKFVGEKAYTKAGGAISHDLFNEVTYFIDRQLLVSLAVDKLDRAAGKLTEGWNWIEISVEHPETFNMLRVEGRPTEATEPLQKQADEIEGLLVELDTDGEPWDKAKFAHFDRLETQLEKVQAEIEDSLEFDTDEQALAGCYVTIDQDGELEIIRGLVRKADEKALKALQAPTSGGKTSKQTQAADLGQELSQALQTDLTIYRANIAKCFLVRHQETASDLLIYTLCMQTFRTHYWGAPLDLTIRETFTENQLSKPDTGRAIEELEAHADILPLEWVSIEDDGERFLIFQGLDQEEKASLMAWCVAQSLDINRFGQVHRPEVELALQDLDIPWHKYFQPTAENYLGRINKEQLLQIGESLIEGFRESADKRSKKQLAQDLESVLAGQDGSMPAEKRAEAIDWIPDGFKGP